MHFQWEGLNTTVTQSVERLWHFIAQRTLLGGRYTGKVEKCSLSLCQHLLLLILQEKLHVFSRKFATELQRTQYFELVTVK